MPLLFDVEFRISDAYTLEGITDGFTDCLLPLVVVSYST